MRKDRFFIQNACWLNVGLVAFSGLLGVGSLLGLIGCKSNENEPYKQGSLPVQAPTTKESSFLPVIEAWNREVKKAASRVREKALKEAADKKNAEISAKQQADNSGKEEKDDSATRQIEASPSKEPDSVMAPKIDDQLMQEEILPKQTDSEKVYGSSPDDPWVLTYYDNLYAPDADPEGQIIRTYLHGYFVAHRWSENGRIIASLPAYIEVDGDVYAYDDHTYGSYEEASDFYPDWWRPFWDTEGCIGLQTCEGESLYLVARYRPVDPKVALARQQQNQNIYDHSEEPQEENCEQQETTIVEETISEEVDGADTGQEFSEDLIEYEDPDEWTETDESEEIYIFEEPETSEDYFFESEETVETDEETIWYIEDDDLLEE